MIFFQGSVYIKGICERQCDAGIAEMQTYLALYYLPSLRRGFLKQNTILYSGLDSLSGI